MSKVKIQKYSTEVEGVMQCHYLSLSERQKRQYAGVEALKLGYGGKIYIRKLLGISDKTLLKGISEIKNNTLTLPSNRQRKENNSSKLATPNTS